MAQSAEEVAEDYKSSLEDLVANSRYEIGVMTQIAKDSMHAAQQITKTLEDHIGRVAPPKKLPALYLLDSIVKNIGMPYTGLFGRNLFKTFMEAYTLVDINTRKKLEELLHTWKMPPTGAALSAPVFPVEITRKIDTALLKAKTAAMNLQQRQARQQQQKMGGPAYSSPHMQHSVPSISGGMGMGRDGYGGYGQREMPIMPTPPPPMPYGMPMGFPPFGANIGQGLPFVDSVTTLKNDISNMIDVVTKRSQENPYDSDLRTKRSALIELRKIVETERLPAEQITQIREQLSNMQFPPPPVMPTPPPPPPPPMPFGNQFHPNNLADLLTSALQGPSSNLPNVSAPPFPPLPPPPPPPANLLALLASTAPQQTSTTATAGPPSSGGDASSLIASLMQAGLLGGAGGAGSAPSLPNLPPLPPPSKNGKQALHPLLSSIQAAAAAQGPHWRTIDVQLNTNSLKKPQPELIKLLYESRPNQCSSCARRFMNTMEGKKEKAAHLDWHFIVNQRLVESEKRGQSRSWYIDEEEWITSADPTDIAITDDTPVPGGYGGNAAAEAEKSQDPKTKFILVPSDPQKANSICGICQEKFETAWQNDVEEWVWMDAIETAGGKIYHASCHDEVEKSKQKHAEQVAQAASSAKKRKAEDDHNEKIKIKKENI